VLSTPRSDQEHRTQRVKVCL